MPLWNVDMETQRTPDLCWEACLHMMWDWRYKGDAQKQAEYDRRMIGLNRYRNRRVTHAEMDRLYQRFGLRSLANPQGMNIRHALGWCPVAVPLNYPHFKHAVVIAGYLPEGNYSVIDPCGHNNRIQCLGATQTSRNAAHVDGILGDFIWYW